MRFWWEDTAKNGLTWSAFCATVAKLAVNTLWRHNEAGDLPGLGDDLDVSALQALVDANRGKRGFTFTHKPLRAEAEREAIKKANASGFIINLSSTSLRDADRLADLEIGPVTVVLATDTPTTRATKTAGGRVVVICPAETVGLTCERCQLCAKPQRKSIVGFRAHGQGKYLIDELVLHRRGTRRFRSSAAGHDPLDSESEKTRSMKAALTTIDGDSKPRHFLLPNEKALQMITACADSVAQAASIPDVGRVISQAEAIQVWMKKFRASEALQKAALALCVDAEIQLGKLSKQLPKLAPSRSGRKADGEPRTIKGKTRTLKEAGIDPARARIAEKLAVVPVPLVHEAMTQKKTVRGVCESLGLMPTFQGESRAEKKVRDLVFLADEAIGLLERLVREPVYQGAIREFRKRYAALTEKDRDDK